MVGIGIVTHNDAIDCRDYSEEPKIFEVLCSLIESIDLFTPYPYILIIRDNDSFDFRFNKLNILLNNKYSHINSHFIPSQVNNLTDAWNEITDLAINTYRCEGVLMLNQDIILTKYWTNLVKAVIIQGNDILAPLTTNAVYQKLQTIEEDAFISEDKCMHVHTIQGFCWGASRKALVTNMYDETNFFDPQVEWDYNEEEWVQRNNKKGGRCLILKNAFVIHLDQKIWVRTGLASTKKLKRMYTKKERHTILNEFSYHDYLENKCIV